MSIAQRFIQECLSLHQKEQVKRWVIAYSGGLDSSVILHLAKQLLPDQPVVAIHINHQLQDQANQWQQFCDQQCQHLNIPFYPFVISPSGKSEQQLRAARYQCFSDFLTAGDCLLFGHHANDQAETLLFRLIRGTGLKGAAAMPVSRVIASGRLLRPILSIDKTQLIEYAQQQALRWVEDPSNQACEYDRNYLRHRVLAPILAHWPRAATKMAAATELLSADYALLEQYLAEDIAKLTCSKDNQTCLDILLWRELSQDKASAVLRSWLAKEIARPVTAKELNRCIDDVINSRIDSGKAYCPLGDYQLRRYQQRLYLGRKAELPSSWPNVQAVAHSMSMVHGSLNLSLTERGIKLIPQMYWTHDVGNLKLPLANRPRKSLKQIFQEHQIAPWLRQGWPILMYENQVVAVAGICVSSNWLEQSETKSLFCLEWQPL